MADENMVQDTVEPRENKGNDGNESDANEEEDQCGVEEFEAVNTQLDQLNIALDSLEQKNDSIHAELIKLLQSNRDARRQFQESQKEQGQESEKSNP